MAAIIIKHVTCANAIEIKMLSAKIVIAQVSIHVHTEKEHHIICISFFK
jgi:hypothetical protein